MSSDFIVDFEHLWVVKSLNTQSAFTYLKLTLETLELEVEYVQS